MAITPLPTAPSRSDPNNFTARADAFMTALPTFANECNATAVAMTLNATNATSTTSLLIGLGNISLTTQTGKSYVIGMTIKVASTVNPINSMLGDVTGYNTSTGVLTANVSLVSGSGTIASWTISQSVAVPGLSNYFMSSTIGAAGSQGFGVGICRNLPSGFSKMTGTDDAASANYGNYQYTDGSVMCWIPAFYYKIGTGSNGLAINIVDIKDYSYYADVATANVAGYGLHRAFYNAGAIQTGVFVDKYQCSNNGGIA